MIVTLRCLAVLLFTALGGIAHAAETWPTRPVRFIVPFPPGTGDFVWRPLAEQLSKVLGQQFVLEHRPGASGTLGAEAAIRATPDGYTFLATPNSPLTVVPQLRKVPYEWEKDLQPVARATDAIGVIALNPDLPPRSLQELLTAARARPENFTCGSAGLGTLSHMRCEVIALKGKAPVRHIPYRGIAEALNDVMAGHISMLADAIAIPHAKGGKVRLLAVFDEQRHPDFPDVPTIAEAGIPDHGTAIWYGLFAPKGVPREIVERLSVETRRILADPELTARLLTAGMRVNYLPADTQRERMRAEWDSMGKLVKDANIKLE